MSAQHAEVCRALRGLGEDYKIEDISSGYAIDIAYPHLGIAVEIDGPSHFARNCKRRLGHTAMKQRHLEQKGWKVFSLGIEDWASAESSAAAIQSLRSLILEQKALQSY